MKNYLAFDFGGSFTKYALMDEHAVILEKGNVPTPKYEEHTLEDFFLVLDGVMETYQERISGIAVSMPGMLDSQKGYCFTGGMLAYFNDTPVRKLMEHRYHLPVSIENDGKCAALAEHCMGSLKGYDNGAVVILGTGVGGGIILNGRLYRGNHFTAGEYSYIATDKNGKFDISSYWGFENGCGALAERVAIYTGENASLLDGIKIFQRANTGEIAVLKALRDFTDLLAVQIYNLNIILDLDVIAIGGGISRQPLLFQYLLESVHSFIEQNPIRKIAPYIPIPHITNCTYYNDANLIGALCHYQKQNVGGN